MSGSGEVGGHGMGSITLEQALQQLVTRTQASHFPLSEQASLRNNLLRCEFDIALSALSLVWFALGQIDVGHWDSDLPPRIHLFHRSLTALWQQEDTLAGTTRTGIFTLVTQDQQRVDPVLHQLSTHTVEVLARELKRLAQGAEYGGNGLVAAPGQHFPDRRLPTRWELVTAFVALHCVHAIVLQENPSDILQRKVFALSGPIPC